MSFNNVFSIRDYNCLTHTYRQQVQVMVIAQRLALKVLPDALCVIIVGNGRGRLGERTVERVNRRERCIVKSTDVVNVLVGVHLQS